VLRKGAAAESTAPLAAARGPLRQRERPDLLRRMRS